jgi:hypothetical protein
MDNTGSLTSCARDVLQEYVANLSRIRGYLAQRRNESTLLECQRLLQQAKQCATAMQAMAEVEGNAVKVTQARELIERDIGPLAKEVQRTLSQLQRESGRGELFSSSYQAPSLDGFSTSDTADTNSDMDSLIQNSADMLRESQSILMETETIGDQTLLQMGRQREQLQSAHRSLEAIQSAAQTAGRLLRTMSRKACTNKWALYAMIAFLIGANLWVLRLIYRKHFPAAHPSTTPAPVPAW